MGNSLPARTAKITLHDGTDVGEATEAGAAFAKAIARMHCIFKDCDDEFRQLSAAVNTHGKESEQFKAAAKRLRA